MISYTIARRLAPIVRLYAANSGINIYSESDAQQQLGRGLSKTQAAIFDAHKDIIIVKETIGDYEMNNAVLHELIHSTGSNSRLARNTVTIVQSGISVFWIERSLLCQEEQTAQYGAYLILKQFFLFAKESDEYTKKYIKVFESGNTNYIADAQKAVDYLNKQFNASRKDKIA